MAESLCRNKDHNVTHKYLPYQLIYNLVLYSIIDLGVVARLHCLEVSIDLLLSKRWQQVRILLSKLVVKKVSALSQRAFEYVYFISPSNLFTHISYLKINYYQ